MTIISNQRRTNAEDLLRRLEELERGFTEDGREQLNYRALCAGCGSSTVAATPAELAEALVTRENGRWKDKLCVGWTPIPCLRCGTTRLTYAVASGDLVWIDDYDETDYLQSLHAEFHGGLGAPYTGVKSTIRTSAQTWLDMPPYLDRKFWPDESVQDNDRRWWAGLKQKMQADVLDVFGELAREEPAGDRKTFQASCSVCSWSRAAATPVEVAEALEVDGDQWWHDCPQGFVLPCCPTCGRAKASPVRIEVEQGSRVLGSRELSWLG